MTSLAVERAASLRRAAIRATLAPSVHNTQPWRLHLTKEGRLDVYADRGRQLQVLDPTSRQLLISCGCAIMNARVALAAEGTGVDIWRTSSPLKSELLASFTPAVDEPIDAALAALSPVVELRQTNRRQFADEHVPDAVMTTLEAAAVAEGAFLFVVRDSDQRLSVATLSRHADDIENLNPAYRAELRAWTSDDPDRRDGVPALAVPHVDGVVQDEIPIRDFDTHGKGGLPAPIRPSTPQTLVLLCTTGDSPAEWLRAGEALERVLLEITRHGYSASPLTQATEVPSVRAQLRSELQLIGYPHVLLRIGRAPVTPASRRRRLVDVLLDES
jgi:nitroreductase